MIKKIFKKMTKKIENTSKTLKNCQKNRKIQTEKNTSLQKKSMNGNKKKSSSLEEETMNYLKKNHNYEKKRMI
jgi:hypothetical protein